MAPALKKNRRDTGITNESVEKIGKSLKAMLADVYCLYLKTKNFHWHMTGRSFRDFHLLLDEHADQILAMGDPIAERARKIGTDTLRSIGDISKRMRLKDNVEETVMTPLAQFTELRDDNRLLARYLRESHELCSSQGDFATTSLIESWIDETERRVWFLSEIVEHPSV
jgi:starvation-inducible DNA-binding protein